MPLMFPPALTRHFDHQAKACDSLGSPFTARLCRLLPELLDQGTATGRRVTAWSGNARADALALRLTGGLHALVLTGTDEELKEAYPPNEANDVALAGALAGALSRNDRFLRDFLSSPPQTNEVARAGMLLPGFLLIARETGLPLAINEIGSSAGLNLVFDRFRYDYGGNGWGDAHSPLVLAPEMRGNAPPLDGGLTIASRTGCDIAPVDIDDGKQRLRLLSYVWADQAARLKRIEAAVDIARAERVGIERADAADFAARRLAERRDGETFVLFHSIMWQYLPQATKDGVSDALDDAGRYATSRAPIARLRMEPLGEAPYATLSLTSWPDGETRRLAKCDYHGRWIEWTGG